MSDMQCWCVLAGLHLLNATTCMQQQLVRKWAVCVSFSLACGCLHSDTLTL
jgi:hypothetical protein